MLKLICNIAIALSVLCFIVTIHELGHYLIGRLLGIKIREFSVGIFGVKFLPKFVDARKTIWRLALLPIGGYVAFVEKEQLEDEGVEEFPVEQEQESLLSKFFSQIKDFFSKSPIIKLWDVIRKSVKKVYTMIADTTEYSAGQIKGRYFEDLNGFDRILLAAAGPMANFVLAFVAFSLLYFFSGRIQKEIYFAESGEMYQAGDLIMSINDKKPMNLAHVKSIGRGGDKVNSIELMRDGKQFQIACIVLPKLRESEGKKIKMPALQSIRVGFEDMLEFSRLNLKNVLALFWGIFNLKFKETENLSGFIGIIRSSFKEMETFYSIVRWMAVLSVSFGVLNLLIIPPFDGSMILFGFIEIIIGRRQKLQDMFSEVAVIVLFFLMFITIRNDIFLKRKDDSAVKEEMESFKEVLKIKESK